MEREKWTTDKLPVGYPKCKRRDLNNAIKDLTDEFTSRSIKDSKDFVNKGWSNRITNFIQLGQNELQHRNNTISLIANGIGLLVAIIAVYLALASLKTSSSWESNQIQRLDEQKQIQQQILEEIRANSNIQN